MILCRLGGMGGASDEDTEDTEEEGLAEERVVAERERIDWGEREGPAWEVGRCLASTPETGARDAWGTCRLARDAARGRAPLRMVMLLMLLVRDCESRWKLKSSWWVGLSCHLATGEGRSRQ